jgi:hypothetical protein
MVDNRATGVGSGGAISFKSSDNTGNASKLLSQKYSTNEYVDVRSKHGEDGTLQEQPFVDKSAQLRAALMSLAMINFPKVINKLKKNPLDDDLLDEDEKSLEEEKKEKQEKKDTL